jgi:N-acetylated-alpha-linked acidic dipeptidase
MQNAVTLLRQSADHYSAALAAFAGRGAPVLPQRSLALINGDLLRVSRAFLNQNGLPDRPWFKNQIYAPGAYTGYGAKPIAAVREYMDERRWRDAEAQVPEVARAMENAASGREADDAREFSAEGDLNGSGREHPCARYRMALCARRRNGPPRACA